MHEIEKTPIINKIVHFVFAGIGKVMSDAVQANLNITPVITAVTDLDTCELTKHKLTKSKNDKI